MSSTKVTIQLTQDQQKQIKDATGKSIPALHIDLSEIGKLSAKELEQVAGGWPSKYIGPT